MGPVPGFGLRHSREVEETMSCELTLFKGTFTTLLAIINPFEVLPVYLKLLEGKENITHRQVAWKVCVYALILDFSS